MSNAHSAQYLRARPRSSVENLANSLLHGELRLRKRRCPRVLAATFQGYRYGDSLPNIHNDDVHQRRCDAIHLHQMGQWLDGHGSTSGSNTKFQPLPSVPPHSVDSYRVGNPPFQRTRGTPIATLGNMVGLTRNNKTRKTCHNQSVVYFGYSVNCHRNATIIIL
jgi:hypothetical protein